MQQNAHTASQLLKEIFKNQNILFEIFVAQQMPYFRTLEYKETYLLFNYKVNW